MAHYAFLDENNIVVNVTVGMDENNISDLPEDYTSWEDYYTDIIGQTCKRTSYNTIGNTHKNGGTAFRGNYASIGFVYDENNDVFYAQNPSTDTINYTLNTNTWIWEMDEE